jgi:rRNA maturation endonuclease Nob1
MKQSKYEIIKQQLQKEQDKLQKKYWKTIKLWVCFECASCDKLYETTYWLHKHNKCNSCGKPIFKFKRVKK